MPTFEERLAAIRGPQQQTSFEDRLSAVRGTGDVRSQIATRQANPDPLTRPREEKTFGGGLYDSTVGGFVDAAKNLTGKNGAGAAAKTVAGFSIPGMVWNAAKGAYEQYNQALDAAKNRDLGGAFGHMAATFVPVIGPAAANAGEHIKSGDIGYGLGEATGLIGQTLLPGAAHKYGGKAITAVSEAANESAIAQYQKVLDPKNLNPDVARPMAERLIDERKVLTDPKTQLTAIQEQRAAKASQGVNEAIDALPSDAVKYADVNRNIDAGRAAATQTFGPNTRATNRAIGQYQSDLVNNVVGDVATKTDVIPPKTARAARQMFDEAPHEKGSTTAAADAQRVIGDAYRQELNKDPGVKAANENFQREKAGKDLAEAIPAKKAGPTPGVAVRNAATKMAVTGAAYAVHPLAGEVAAAVMGGGELLKVARDVFTSPGYKTWSAVQKAKFAQALSIGDSPTVVQMSADAGVKPPDTPEPPTNAPFVGGKQLTDFQTHQLAKQIAAEKGWNIEAIGQGRKQNPRATPQDQYLQNAMRGNQ